MLEVVTKNKEWKQGAYSVKIGPMGENRKDVYHVYKSGKYAAQRNSLEGCQDWINDDIEERKGK